MRIIPKLMEDEVDRALLGYKMTSPETTESEWKSIRRNSVVAYYFLTGTLVFGVVTLVKTAVRFLSRK